MYALSGTSTNHISVFSSDVTNLEDLAVSTNVAKFDVLLKSTGHSTIIIATASGCTISGDIIVLVAFYYMANKREK